MGGGHRLERPRLPRIRHAAGDHLQRLPHHRRQGGVGGWVSGGFRTRDAPTCSGLLLCPEGGLPRHQPRGTRSFRGHSLAGGAVGTRAHLLLQEGQGSPGPVLRIGCGRWLGPADRRDGGRAFARSQYPPVHRSSHAALAGQHVHLRSRGEDAPSQRRFRAAPGHLEALRRRGRPQHRHGRSQQVLRQHPHALRRPDTEDAGQDRRDGARDRGHSAQPRRRSGADPRTWPA